MARHRNGEAPAGSLPAKKSADRNAPALVAHQAVAPFSEYQIPLATLTLLQRLGRLIRTRSDRGVLAILDPRITRMGYGRRFLKSLPPAPISSDLNAIARFLA